MARTTRNFYRLPSEQRLAKAAMLRSRQVRVTTRPLGKTYEGRVLAVGTALHGTSSDWLALAGAGLDRFISLATIETIERVTEDNQQAEGSI